MIRHSLPRTAYNKWTEIDLGALRQNLKTLRRASTRHAPRIMGVVKANAYGHNISLIAPALYAEGVRDFGVATLGEALYLRTLLPVAPNSDAPLILILGAQAPQQYADIIAEGLDFILHSAEDVPLIERLAQAQGRKARLHLKVDTGMGRVGCLPKEIPAILNHLAQTETLELIGICSHLATSDQPQSSYVAKQLQCFKRVRQIFKSHPLQARFQPLFHLANSDAVLHYPETHFDLVRPGIALYGYAGQPCPDLQPVLSLKSMITQYREVPSGTHIGYGCSFTTQRPSRLAVVAIGYADGLNRLLSNRANVLIAGQRAPMVGRISMDQVVLDLSETQIAGTPGSEVILIGRSEQERISAQDWADKLDTIPYEILTSLGTRLPRYLAQPEVNH